MQIPLKKQVTVIVNDKPFRVEVDDLNASPVSVTVNGQAYLVTIQAEAMAVAPDTSTDAPPPPPASTGSSAKSVTAPMPGNIIEIQVKAGDAVSLRQPLCSLEAMKMKNAIRSPRDGVIAAVAVSEGQTVAHGDVLFTFE